MKEMLQLGKRDQLHGHKSNPGANHCIDRKDQEKDVYKNSELAHKTESQSF